MFNFSANHLFLLSRTEYRKCAVFLLRDLDTQRVYRLYDFTKALLLRPGVAYSVAGKEWQASHSLPNGKDRIMRRKVAGCRFCWHPAGRNF